MENNENLKEISADGKDNVADLPVTAEAAEAENKDNAAQFTGKFKNADALFAAYKSLEAEFTRRSQRLKELEEENKAARAGGAPSPNGTEINSIDAALADETVRKAVIEDYLKSVAANKTVPVISGGVSAAAPKNAPKTVKEAGALAEAFLKNNK